MKRALAGFWFMGGIYVVIAATKSLDEAGKWSDVNFRKLFLGLFFLFAATILFMNAFGDLKKYLKQ